MALYLNDVAAGAILEIPAAWPADEAVEKVATGLRHLLQELWHLDLVRPVLAVYTTSEGMSQATARQLRRLTWDDERHRGDFALREASSREDTEDLLFTLMGDTMGKLDAAVREDRVGVPEVREVFATRRREIDGSEEAASRLEAGLLDVVLTALERAETAREAPRLVDALESWREASGRGM